MQPRRVSAKFFVSPDPEAAVDLAPFTPLFHAFIQRSALDGMLLDVADYAHVPEGPGIVLIGHEVDYGLDQSEGRAGLLTVRKRAGDTPTAELVADTLRKALGCVQAIEEEGSTGLRFALDRVEIAFLDRLAAPNDAAAFERARAELAPVFERLYGEGKARIERQRGDDPRRPLAALVSGGGGEDAATLLARLAA